MSFLAIEYRSHAILHKQQYKHKEYVSSLLLIDTQNRTYAQHNSPFDRSCTGNAQSLDQSFGQSFVALLSAKKSTRVLSCKFCFCTKQNVQHLANWGSQEALSNQTVSQVALIAMAWKIHWLTASAITNTYYRH